MGVILFILKLILWLILAVIGLIVIVLILPISAEVSFIGKKLSFRAKLWIINIYDSDGRGLAAWFLKRRKKKKSEETPPPADTADMHLEAIDELDLSPDEESESCESGENASEEKTESVSAADEKEEEKSEEKQDEVSDTASDDVPDEESDDDGRKPKKSGEKPESGDSDKQSLPEKIMDILEIADGPLLMMCKAFKFSDLYLDLIIANEDAYKCALNYGRISGAIYWLLGKLSVLCNVKFRTVDINPGFALKESRWDASVKMSFSLMGMVIPGIWFLITYIFKIFIPDKLRRSRKSAARQK